ncbi:MAG: metallophosphoesterase [Clostridia bacterium]|nr:metallophosphoesterase [Clostridia bacterium]
MRNYLIILRGCPGSGKDTWLKENNLEEFAISSDNLRLLYQPPQKSLDNKLHILNTYDKQVWELLFNIMEIKMKQGQLIIVNACNINEKTLNKYFDLCSKYIYQPVIINFNVELNELIKRNQEREQYKQVPEFVVRDFYNRMQNSKLSNTKSLIFSHTYDIHQLLQAQDNANLLEYSTVNIIGDIHGCFTTLQQAIPDIKDDELYIFLGDYLDRGTENKQTLEFFLNNYTRKNFICLWGNHESHLFNYVNNWSINSKEFMTKTINEISSIDKRRIKHFLNSLKPFYKFVINIQGKPVEINCSHAGCTEFINTYKLPLDYFTKGIGGYEDIEKVYALFENQNSSIQVHGHRNINKLDIKATDKCYNLEGGVEFGRELRCIKITNQAIETLSYKNDTINYELNIENNAPVTLENFILQAREKPKTIIEKRIDENISSFNFSKDAFFSQDWNSLTMKARGLFIDTRHNKIVARGYEKFFNIEERPETMPEHLAQNMQYPVTAYLKYNGFLGILSYNKNTDDLLFCSKSSATSKFANLFKTIFIKQYNDKISLIKQYLKENSVSMIFEVIDPISDPHIIENDKAEVILLDIITNSIIFEHLPYEQLVDIATYLGITKVKEKCYTINNGTEMMTFISQIKNPTYKYKDKYIEGFVLEDSNSFMVKYKTPYYNFWKEMRKVCEKLRKEQDIDNVVIRTTDVENTSEVIDFIKTNYNITTFVNDEEIPADIITLRKLYYKNLIK